MEDNDLCIRTLRVALDFEANAREMFRVPQRYSVVPKRILAGIRVAGLNEYVCLESFTAHAPISIKLDVADDVAVYPFTPHDSGPATPTAADSIRAARQHQRNRLIENLLSRPSHDVYACCLPMSTKGHSGIAASLQNVAPLMKGV